MDRRLHALLLNAAVAAAILATPGTARAADPVGASPGTPQVVEPRVQRRDVKAPAIDTENFEGGLFIGTVSIEDFGSSLLYGARIAYHLSEDFFAEAIAHLAATGPPMA